MKTVPVSKKTAHLVTGIFNSYVKKTTLSVAWLIFHHVRISDKGVRGIYINDDKDHVLWQNWRKGFLKWRILTCL